MVALPTLRPPSRSAFFALRLEEREVLVENVLDAEEHVAEPGRAHGRRQVVAAGGDRARHALDDVVDVVEAGGDDRVAQAPEARDVQRDVVVDDEDRPCAARAGVARCPR